MAKTTLMAELERLVSEARNPETMQIDLMTSSEIVAAMNKQDAGVAEAVKKILPQVAATVDRIVEAFKAGGRVMKNVTGYDLPKLLCGSFGTLAVMTDITVKVLPAPEKSRTVLVLGLGDAEARDAMAAALNSPHEVSGAAHLPTRAAARSGVRYVRSAGRPVTAIRVEGFGRHRVYRWILGWQCIAGRIKEGATHKLGRAGKGEREHRAQHFKHWVVLLVLRVRLKSWPISGLTASRCGAYRPRDFEPEHISCGTFS